MHTIACLAAFLLLSFALPAQDLNSYRWKNRLVLVFAPEASHPLAMAQHQLLDAHQAGLTDRAVEVLWLNPTLHQALYTQYRIDTRAFGVILVGKDGGEKLRSEKPVTAEALFGLIDAMPMRQAEVRRQKP
jgi:hypothetical protein